MAFPAESSLRVHETSGQVAGKAGQDGETGKDIHEINLKVDKLNFEISSGGINCYN